ncbi:unnamed protein product [Didymodactylos carnosus]|uniref:RBR-type E3 ubiquitin transferase n=1 Tax=Didymodactylos carnosus TaxID=1234261 RepID=A0A8S2N3S5_9BILA|nr:unnamed protein product [Didymodactylos carnosus]CAF3987802.1 unnamed protein product [Didymodactylos carnosus]
MKYRPIDQAIVFDCQHSVCLECFKDYAISSLNSRNFVFHPTIGYTLGCLEQCPNTLIKDLHHFQLIGKVNYEKYKKFAAEEYVVNNGGLLCPTVGCGCGLLIDDKETNRKIVCPECHTTFCRECKSVWNDEKPCCLDRTTLKENYLLPLPFWGYLFGLKGNQNGIEVKKVRQCPKCHVTTEKDG